MQQPMQPQEQLGNQLVSHQMSQQMVLCPVRFVYETQILVQPGEQIQPNQTFFINPQNPPPWMQNRQIQSQAPVVYVQNLPNNIVSSVQQPIDQNQLYLQQNIANYQMQQQLLQNQQELTTMQLANIMPNMVQNVQPTQNERIHPNTMNQQSNQALVQNQMQLANARQLQNQVNQNMDVQRQVFMNLRPQMVPQIIQRPVMTMTQPQNIPTQTVPTQVPTQQNIQAQNMQTQQTFTSMPNVQLNQQSLSQMFVTNVGQQIPNTNIRTQPNNIVNVQPVAKVREITPELNKTTNNTIGSVVPTIRNVPQNITQNMPQNAYRPIQPRPQIPQSMVKTQTVPINSIPVMYTDNKQHSHHNIINIAANTTYLNNPMNRKRKSESPDEILKKMAANTKIKPSYNIPQQNISVTKLSHDIGVNTSPKHMVNKNVFHLNTVPAQNANQNIIKLLEHPQPTETQKPLPIETNITASQIEKDKLVRNTVFTQARGRVLQVNENLIPKPNEFIVTELPKTTEITKMETQTDKPIPMDVYNSNTVANVEPPKIKHVAFDMPILEMNDSKTIAEEAKEKRIKEVVKVVENTNISVEKNHLKIQENKLQIEENKARIDENKVKIEMNKAKIEQAKVKLENKIKTEVNNIKKEEKVVNIVANIQKIDKTFVKPEEKKAKIEEKVVKLEESKIKKEERKEKIEEEAKIEENKVVIKQEKDFILTHVVDGYVIQESNFAFPIRKPLKEKTLYTNTKTEESEKRDLVKESMREELKSHAVDIPLLPFHYLLLNSDKKEEELKEEKIEIKHKLENPFSQLQASTVKSWTVDDLSAHLLHHKWKETASVLLEQQIDGESLLLVSKAQLVTIGVSEEHADAICEFVKS